MMTRRLVFLVVALLCAVSTQYAQIESPVLVFNRGMLWQSVFWAKVGPNFSNWGRRGIGLDWPGFDETYIRENIGGAASHLVTGGFWIGAKKTRDTILAVEDWSIYGGTISSDAGAKYVVTRHTFKHKNGSNYWLKASPLEGEEVIETEWQYNLNYTNIDDRERQLPIRVTRTMHQWNGSRRDENYIIHEYVFRNISPELRAAGRNVPDTLFGVRLLLCYGMHANSRSWSVLYPSLTPGARNTWFFYDLTRRLMYGRAGKWLDSPGSVDESFGFTTSQGPVINGTPSGEWLAPGIVGVRLLYSSPDSTGIATRVGQWGWSAASPSIDLSGPFTNIPGTNEAKYAVLSNIATTFQYVNSSGDTALMRRSRMWSLMSLGPWTIRPGDSVVVALAEMVDGTDYHYAVKANTSINQFAGTAPGQGTQVFLATADKARFTYDQRRNNHGFNHPDPPAAPKYTLDFYKKGERVIATVVEWGSETEGLLDPDDQTDDLAGYKIYRSSYLPIGPWDSLAVIPRGDPRFYDATSRKYSYVDSAATPTVLYYYALTAFDTGKASWPVDRNAVFPETRSNRVPPLESSIFANRNVIPFRATFKAPATVNDILVVPNPLVTRTGIQQAAGGFDPVHFVNVPNPCTIRVYTVRGDLVATLQVPADNGGIYAWIPVSDYGQYIKSGVYVFHVDSPGGTKIGKFAVIR